jgi:DNA-binding NarL/FixJ family response regulator
MPVHGWPDLNQGHAAQLTWIVWMLAVHAVGNEDCPAAYLNQVASPACGWPANQGAAVAARILQRFDTRPARPADAPAMVPLTGSELAVLRFLPSHMTNQEIAEALFLSINTVKTHLRSVYRKLGVRTRRQAISTADRLGLL